MEHYPRFYDISVLNGLRDPQIPCQISCILTPQV